MDGDVHTQTIEGFWASSKNGIRGAYHSVSAKWLQGYLNEYAWRYNRRDCGSMFHALLAEAVNRRGGPSSHTGPPLRNEKSPGAGRSSHAARTSFHPGGAQSSGGKASCHKPVSHTGRQGAN